MTNYFLKYRKNGQALYEAIEAVCEGLIYVSETDAPVVPFAGTPVLEITGKTILRQAGRKTDEAVEEASFEKFFDRLTAVKDWFGEGEKARAERFLELRRLLEENLRDLKVFRIGKIQVEILAVGLDKDGCVMGVTANAVET